MARKSKRLTEAQGGVDRLKLCIDSSGDGTEVIREPYVADLGQ